MPIPITVSLRSRGLLISQVQRQQGLTGLARRFAHDFANLGCSILYNVVLLPLIAWFSVIVALLSTVFAYSYRDGVLVPDPSIMLPYCFLVYLPILALVLMGYARRNNAQEALNHYKTAVVGLHALYSSCSSVEGPWSTVPGDLAAMTEDLVGYLQHPRPNTTYFELSGLSSTTSRALLQLSQEMGLLIRRLHWHIKKLAALIGGAPPEQVPWVASLHHQVAGSVEALVGLKEGRSPVLMRSAMTSYAGVVLPVFFGPFFAAHARSSSNSTSQLVFGIVTGVVLQIMVMTLWQLAVLLEDPFDPAVPDGVSCGEMQAGLAWMLSPEMEDCPLPTYLATSTAVGEQGPGAGVTAQVQPQAAVGGAEGGAAGGGKAAAWGPASPLPPQQQQLDVQQVAIGMPPMPHLG